MLSVEYCYTVSVDVVYESFDASADPFSPGYSRRCRETVLLSLPARAQLKRAFCCRAANPIISNHADVTIDKTDLIFHEVVI